MKRNRAAKIATSAAACVCAVSVLFSGCGADESLVYMKDLQSNKIDLSGYELTFEDDFDGDALDTKVWTYCDEGGQRRGGYWIDDAVSVKDSNLRIAVEYREDGELGSGWYTGAVESTASENGATGFSQKYGYFEARCKVPKIYGAWAAFWLMPVNNFKDDVPGSGDDGSEIDIFESMYMYMEDPDYQNSVTHAIHIDGYGDNLKSLGSKHFSMEDLYDTYHTYGLEWNENEYIFYIDGIETWRVSQTPDKEDSSKVYNNVSHVAEYIILSCEVSGTTKDGKVYPGQEFNDKGELVTAWSGSLEGNDKNTSYEFLVDYVRVYEKKA